MRHRIHQLGSPFLQPPHSFFSAQQPDPLHFYYRVLWNRFFGHCLQGKRPFSVGDSGMPGTLGIAALVFRSCEGQGLEISLDCTQAISLWSVVLVSHLEVRLGPQAFQGMKPVGTEGREHYRRFFGPSCGQPLISFKTKLVPFLKVLTLCPPHARMLSCDHT